MLNFSAIAFAIAAAVAMQGATQYAPIAKGATYTQAPTRHAYGAGAEGRRYFHPVIGRWVLSV